MKNSDIVNLLKLRFAVYKAGCGKGLWPCLEDNAAKEYMNYLFPKSSKLAFYNLMINIVQKTHENFIPKDMYSLFKCPIQIEEETYVYLKHHLDDDVHLGMEPLDFISSMATVACDPCFEAINIGKLSDDIDNSLRVMAYHYTNLFTNSYCCYPYFN